MMRGLEADLLQKIQTLQFTERVEAEQLLRAFIKQQFPLEVEKVELRPQAVSLNSFNGFLTLVDGEHLFFKTHTEQDNVIGEYYNAKMLADAGYPVIQPIYSSTQAGQHLLIYEVIDDPSVFDVAWEVEQGQDTPMLAGLRQAQNRSDDDLYAIYEATLANQDAADAEQNPIHQLFYHRLTGGRYTRFYGDHQEIVLPQGTYGFGEVKQWQWEINGQVYPCSFNDLITYAIDKLHPAQTGPSIIGHGDAHNGNVFYHAEEGSLTYFDPAFAGRHDPLLDLTKPLFHNVFALWMYFPHKKQAMTDISMSLIGRKITVEHDYHLPELRHMFLRSKVERTLIPTAQLLEKRNMLREDWREYLKLALFCCPFLTLNLADAQRFPAEMTLLGLAMSVEMGGESKHTRSLIDIVLDEVESAL